MKLARSILLSLVIMATSFPVFVQSAPEGLRDLKWGATHEQVLLAFPSASCETSQREFSDWTCALRYEEVNGVSVMVILRGYTTGKVVGMSGFSLSFKSDEVRRIVDAFESRYGKPSRVEEKDFLTKAGARFPNTEWRWEFPDSTITIHQHSGRLGNAIAIVSLRSTAAELWERTEQRKRGAGKGL